MGKQKRTKCHVWLAATMMLGRNILKEQCQSGSCQKRLVGLEMGALGGATSSRLSHLNASATKSFGFYSSECLPLLGLSIQLALLQNKTWPETWLPSETAVGWNLHVASSEVSIEQTRSGTSCKKPWWYLPKDVAANATSTLVGSLQCLEAGHSQWCCPGTMVRKDFFWNN